MAWAVNAGLDPGKDGERINAIKPVLDQDDDEGSAHGIKWWPDDED